MAEIVPEERVQKVKAHLAEDLDFEPERIRNFFTSNIFTRAFSHLVGWTGRRAKMLRCTEAGELKTAPTSTGIERYSALTGNGADDWSVLLQFADVASRIDFFLWDNAAIIDIHYVPTGQGGEIEVPVGFYSVDIRSDGFKIKNKTAGNTARYQVIGWW